MTKTLKVSVRTRGGDEFAAGTQLTIAPLDDFRLVATDAAGRRIFIPYAKAHRYLEGFPKPPGLRSIMRMVENGYCRSVAGKKVEPDGHDDMGFPSWARALCFI